MHIHQLVSSTTTRSTAAVLQPLLRAIDPDSGIHDASSLGELMAEPGGTFRESLVLLHAGAASAAVTDAMTRHADVLVVIDSGDTDVVELEQAFDPGAFGRRTSAHLHLQMVADRARRAIAFSERSAQRLRAFGYQDVVICPPLVDISVASAEPHGPTVNHFATQVTGPVFVSLGGVEPVQRNELLVKGYHVLATHIDATAHLAMLGMPRPARYAECIEHQINELNLNRAWMTGELTDEQLRVYLDGADVVLSTRIGEVDHRALTLAMTAGVPVVATDAREIERYAAGTVVLPENAGPQLLAEAMHEVVINSSLRDGLTVGGKASVVGCDHDVALASLLAAVLEVAR